MTPANLVAMRSVGGACAVLVAVVMAGSLTGCATHGPPALTPTAVSRIEPSTTPPPETSADLAPTPTGTPLPAETDCQTVLTTEAYAAITADGLTPRADPGGDTPALKQMRDAGALVCGWRKPYTDFDRWFAVLDTSAWPNWYSELTATGWTPYADLPDSTAIQMIEVGNGEQMVVAEDAGRLYFINNSRAVRWIPAFSD